MTIKKMSKSLSPSPLSFSLTHQTVLLWMATSQANDMIRRQSWRQHFLSRQSESLHKRMRGVHCSTPSKNTERQEKKKEETKKTQNKKGNHTHACLFPAKILCNSCISSRTAHTYAILQAWIADATTVFCLFVRFFLFVWSGTGVRNTHTTTTL